MGYGRFARHDFDNLRRTKATAIERVILAQGLSPWSNGVKCDVCSNIAKYMEMNHIAHKEPIHRVGRWMLHSACHDRAKREGLLVLNLPRLDYSIYRGYPPLVQIELMKIYLAEESWNRIEECAVGL